DSGRNLYIPIMVSPKEKISNTEKVLLSSICLILYELKGIDSDFAKIVYGYNLKSEKVNINVYLKEAKVILRELLSTVKNETSPHFYQNSHCKICEFQSSCREKLIEKDDLSLLGRISQKEIIKQNKKGVFTIHQLSYTFRPKRKRKNASQNNQRFPWELK